MGEDVSSASSNIKTTSNEILKTSMSAMFDSIIGTKCRAPFTQEWGEKTYGNAMIAEVDTESDMDNPKVKIPD